MPHCGLPQRGMKLGGNCDLQLAGLGDVLNYGPVPKFEFRRKERGLFTASFLRSLPALRTAK
jgi:hypothetical protein